MLRNSFFEKSDEIRKIKDENGKFIDVSPIIKILPIPSCDLAFNFIEIGESRDYLDSGFYKEGDYTIQEN